jgi:hypothetical protein
MLSSINRIMTWGMTTSLRNDSCCKSSRVRSVGPGYLAELVSRVCIRRTVLHTRGTLRILAATSIVGMIDN